MVSAKPGAAQILGRLSLAAFVMTSGIAGANPPSHDQAVRRLAQFQHQDFTPPLDTRTAQQLAEAQYAYQQHDFATEIRIEKRLAEQGVAEAQGYYGCEFYNGEGGTPRDYKRAMIWFRRAASQNDVWAQDRIGEMYYKGQGVPKDYVLADMWWKIAARDIGTVTKRSGLSLSEVVALDRDALERKLPSYLIQHAQVMAAQCRASNFKTCD